MESKYELIEKYLMNELSVREKLEFEDSLRNDPELMKEYLLRKDINNALIEDDIINLRDVLDEVINESPSRKFKLTCAYSAVAAIVVLFIGIACIYLFPPNKIDNKEIFNTYYNPYPSLMNYRSADELTKAERLIYHGVGYYDSGEFNQASEVFKNILKQDSDNYMCQFYLAICEIEKGNLGIAEEYLNELIQKKDNLFWEQSHWYLALVYLRENQTDKAKNMLQKIIHENMSYKADAELILEIL